MKTGSERTPEAHPHGDGNDWWNIHTFQSIFLPGIKPCVTGPRLQIWNLVYQPETEGDTGGATVNLFKTSRLPGVPSLRPLHMAWLCRRWRYSRQSCLALLWTFTSTGHIPCIKAFTVRYLMSEFTRLSPAPDCELLGGRLCISVTFSVLSTLNQACCKLNLLL